ncbi:MAG: hypothetical protein PHV81_01240 [Candidatus Methanomethylophilaceae archaeon]|jgi:hypothetical protein|nr:hypothetical protein [Candidatus Methanomethylophilaceae archaeon]NCA73620.1 hypothetical protein [Gammaproteobacteria bacterium]MDD2936428.1 hypothetical protein [Candidatus Methanomethylophilaceae archaeon]MDD3351648.1 hypothetical protein [Candidatus Methanomethylophilaceae archaeon]MDD3986874.1 hypothetical protein [Candidatus Methanomethylophilaceae archaeon]
MTVRPKIVKAGFGFGILGGLIAGIAALMAFAPETAATANMWLGFLVVVLFFALGGMFKTEGSVSWGVVVFMAALATGVTVAVTMFEAMDIWFGIILTVIGVIEIVIAANSMTGRWIKTDRLLS